MSLTQVAYTPATGLKDSVAFPTTPVNEAAARKQVQDMFDQIKDAVNVIVGQLVSVVDGSSGADQIATTAITDLTGATVQALLESIRNNLKATADGASGADFVAATDIAGLTGSTAQALLEALKAYIDTHKSSTDHDGRYYSETEIDSGSLTMSNKTLTSPILNTGVSGTAIDTDVTLGANSDTKLASQKASKTYIDTVANNFVLGAINDKSVTNPKLADDIKVGSLATLTTTVKTSVVGAINELDSDLGSVNSTISTLGSTYQNKRTSFQIYMSGWKF